MARSVTLSVIQSDPLDPAATDSYASMGQDLNPQMGFAGGASRRWQQILMYGRARLTANEAAMMQDLEDVGDASGFFDSLFGPLE